MGQQITRTKYENAPLSARICLEILEENLALTSTPSIKKESVFDVLDADIFCSKNDPDDVESEGITRPLESGNPDLRRSAQLALLPPTHRADRPTKRITGAGLHFDERDGPIGIQFNTRGHQIDITMSVPKSMLDDVPAMYL